MALKYKIFYNRNNTPQTAIKYIECENQKQAKHILIDNGIFTETEIQKVERKA